MIGKKRKLEKINSELSRKQTQLILNPDLSMVVVFTGNRIITQQKATTNHAIHDMPNRHFLRSNPEIGNGRMTKMNGCSVRP